MESKSTSIIIGGNEFNIPVTKQFINHLVDVFKANGFGKNKTASVLGFPRSTFFEVINAQTNLNQSAVDFVNSAFKHISEEFACDYLYNESSKSFIKIRGKTNHQFFNGAYYGYFKKSDSANLMHFVLIINGLNATMWTTEKVASGPITYDEETYSMVLGDSRNRNNIEFILGKKHKNKFQKVFISTWRTDDCQIHSALCMILYVKDQLYDTIEKIIANRKALREHILANTPDYVELYFNDQGHKFIRKELSEYEHEEY